ncbi:MAG: sulfatase-like hydrolase/transferase [Thermoleophilaceae bacterium]
MSDALTRRRLLRRGGAAAGAAALGGGLAGAALRPASAAAQEGRELNVLVIVVNGIRADSVGAFDGAFDDNRVAKTPNIDKLAGDSLRFERAVAESTPAVPARRALITGRHAFPYREWRRMDRFAPEPGWNPVYVRQPLVTEALVDAGVETVWITDNPFFSGPRYDDVVRRTIEVDPDDYPAPDPVDAGGTMGREQTHRDVERHLVGGIERCAEATERAVAQGIRELDRLRDKRFFLAVDGFDSAEAYAVPRTWTRSLDLDPSLDAIVRQPAWIVAADIGDETVAMARDAYMEGVRTVDRAVGDLMRKVEDLDLLEDTAVFLVGDGHTMLGEHGWLGRGAPGSYKHAYFTPYLIRDPRGRRSGNYSYYYASTHDVAPTALSLMGVDIPGRMDGEDLTALLDDEDPPKRKAFMAATITKIAAGDPRWLMLTDMDKAGIQLHDFDEDNDKDDDERENVVRKYPQVVEELWKVPLAVGQGTLPDFDANGAVRPLPEDDDLDDDGIEDRDETNDETSGGTRDSDADDLEFDQSGRPIDNREPIPTRTTEIEPPPAPPEPSAAPSP